MASKVTLGGELLYPSDYLAAVEFKGKDVTLTIKNVALEDLIRVGGKKDKKPVLTFNGTMKKLVLNKTNASIIAAMYGTEAKAWIGKKITLYPTKAKYGRDTVDAIRVREGAGHAQSPAPEEADQDAQAKQQYVEEVRTRVHEYPDQIDLIAAEVYGQSKWLGEQQAQRLDGELRAIATAAAMKQG